MPQKKHVKLNVISYRKIVLDRGATRLEQEFGFQTLFTQSEWDINFISLPPEEQNTLLSEGTSSYREVLPKLAQNHPLVEKGIAFWLNEKTLVTGYTLKNNPQIFRPIFQVDKESLKFKLRDEIRKYAKFYTAHKRQMLYKKTLMNIEALNILPESIISMIAHLTYDYRYYLKL